jgi:hypothetical protein
MNGLQNILIRGLGLQLVGLPALVLLAYALSLFTLACGDLRGWMRDNYPFLAAKNDYPLGQDKYPSCGECFPCLN